MKYPLLMRLIHWLMAIIILTLIAVGFYMADLPKEDALRDVLYPIHKSFGVTIFMLIILRIIIRFSTAIPPLPHTISKRDGTMAHIAYVVMYGLMICIPIFGYVMSNAFGFKVAWFGIAIPVLVGTDISLGKLFQQLHAYAAFTLLAIIVIHTLAVVKHVWFDKENLLKRIW